MLSETRRGRIITFPSGVLWRAQAVDGGYVVLDVSGDTEADALATLAQTALEAMENADHAE